MVGALPRREGVRLLMERSLWERRGGALLQISRADYRYVTHPRDNGPLATKLRQIVQKYPRYGYRRAWATGGGARVAHKPRLILRTGKDNIS